MFSHKLISECNFYFASKVFRPFHRKVFGKRSSHAQYSRSYGQPTYQTHPYILSENDITPCITKQEFSARRSKLIELVNKQRVISHPTWKDHLIVIPSATKQYMSEKIPYVFRQNTDFLYLSGCQEPDSILLISCNSGGSCTTLFMRERDEHSELWDGPRTGPDNASSFFGVEQGLPVAEFEKYLECKLKQNPNLIIWYDYSTPVQMHVHKVLHSVLTSSGHRVLESPKEHLHQIRLIKSPAEISLMQQSCDIAAQAIIETIIHSRPGQNEYEMFAKVDYESRIRGAEFLAYPPVVAGGARANIIHYINNNQVVRDGELVLMDAGCEFHGYASDITRTWPISGDFSPEQLIIYQVLLYVQKELINQCANLLTLDELFESMCVLLGRELQAAGILPKTVTIQTLRKLTCQLCPHHVSHYLGMDVHDTAMIKRNIKLKPGMILTIEPGVYINSRQTLVPSKFRGIGMRIEDDILITQNGPVVLSRNCPKEVADIVKISSRNQR